MYQAYGISEFPDKLMTTHSLFSTCSTTKAFTAAAVSLVINESKFTSSPINWGTPVSSLIRDDFVLADDYATNHTTLEDALSHRSGLPGHEGAMACANPTESIQEAVRKMRYLPLAYQPRTTWKYCNHMYIAVSHMLEQWTGVDLGSFLKKRIWDPLDMKDTYFSLHHILNSPQLKPRLVQGYSWIPETNSYTPEPYMNYTPTKGAGAIVGNVLDYTKWLRALIFKLGPLSHEILDPLLKPRSIIHAPESLYPPTLHHLYALGWWVENYTGEQFYWHSGSWPGFGIMVGFIPAKEFGFAIMGNSVDARMVAKKLYMHLMDRMLGLSVQADSEDKPAGKSETLEEAMNRLYPSIPDHPLPLSLPLAEYAGLYRNPGYGEVAFRVNGSKLTADFSDRVIPNMVDLHHVSGEFFLGRMYSRNSEAHSTAFYRAEFYIDAGGNVKRVGLELEPALKGEKIWYER